jgi:hypothetical protein
VVGPIVVVLAGIVGNIKTLNVVVRVVDGAIVVPAIVVVATFAATLPTATGAIVVAATLVTATVVAAAAAVVVVGVCPCKRRACTCRRRPNSSPLRGCRRRLGAELPLASSA